MTPHLDYGNGLLYGTKSNLIAKLQVAQKSAVRLIEKLKKHDRVTESRKQLHWLPIPARIHFKLMMTTWKALNNQAPKYIQQLIQKREHQSYDVRSNNKLLLENPVSLNTNKFEDRAFSFAAPKLWNTLPEKVTNAVTLSSFKKKLENPLVSNFLQKLKALLKR